MNLPKEFIQRLEKQFGKNSSELVESFDKVSPTSIRVHPSKLKEFSGEKIPWSQFGFYLKERPLFTIDPLLHSGCYYVQEASSMFLEQAFTQLFSSRLNVRDVPTEEKIAVLDLCAAPGGKSTHFASLLNDKSVLVSNEVIGSRATVLKENIIKQGRGNVIVTNSDPKDFGKLNETFDFILLDAPCSGEGLFRKDKKAINEWSESNAHHCSLRQKRILEDVLPCLKKDGFLIYSTCTFNPEENEMQLKWLKEKYGFSGVRLKTESSWNVDEWNDDDLYAYKFLPHKVNGEGFFLAVLSHHSQTSPLPLSQGEGNTVFRKEADKKNYSRNIFLPEKCNSKEQQLFSDWVKKHDDENIFNWRENFYLLSNFQIDLIKELSVTVKVIYAGVEMAEKKRDELIPSFALALFDRINSSTFNSIHLEKEQALKYLRRESLPISSNEKGWMLTQFENHPLGWVKAVGNRMNNYFPMEWRIRNY